MRSRDIAALKVIDRGDLSPDEMIGSWAGELGQTQFLPVHYVNYAVDYDGDGWLDIVKTNFSDDTATLYRNNRDGTFSDVTLSAGFGKNTQFLGWGTLFVDVDNDGWPDLFVANIDQELFSLYHNQKDATFVDEPGEIGPATRLLSGWGLKFFDYDNDGDPDLFLANGHPDDMVETLTSRVKYKEPILMFENIGGKFKDVSAQSGAVFAHDYPARGLAVGDYDNDGDLDVLISNNGGAPLLLRNDGGNRNNWLGLQLVATKSNPAAVGAIITWRVNGVTRSRLKTSGGSYLASHDPREILGAGRGGKIDSVEIHWPSGKIDKLTNPPMNTYIRVVEGEGIAKGPSIGAK